METKKIVNGSKVTINVEGRVDTMTSPALEKVIKESIDGTTDLVLDFGKVEYISSAGLRVLLSTQKIMMKQGEMIIRHVNDEVMEVFEITGFLDILTIE